MMKKNNYNDIILSGDSRFDRVKIVIDNAEFKAGQIINKSNGCIYLVAGSTYKVSEKKLLSVVKKLNDNIINTGTSDSSIF